MNVEPDNQVASEDSELAAALAELNGGTDTATEEAVEDVLPEVQAVDEVDTETEAAELDNADMMMGAVPDVMGAVPMGVLDGTMEVAPELIEANVTSEMPVTDPIETAESMGAVAATEDMVPMEDVVMDTAPVEPVADMTGGVGATEPVESFSIDTSGAVSPENEELGALKREALTELRPLVDRLGLGKQERFDIYILMIRSTNDKSLVELAFGAAREIEDEDKKARALLDVIKEIDFLEKQ